MNLDGKKVKRKHCNQKQRPQRTRKCNQRKCKNTLILIRTNFHAIFLGFSSCKDVQQTTKTRENKDYTLILKGKPALVYCDKMDSSEPEEYISLSRQNFGELFNQR